MQSNSSQKQVVCKNIYLSMNESQMSYRSLNNFKTMQYHVVSCRVMYLCGNENVNSNGRMEGLFVYCVGNSVV